MSTVLEIDKQERAVISIAFRILLSAYALFLIIYKHVSLQWYFCLGFFIAYWAIYLLLYEKEKFLSLLRLVNDYAFIGILLWKINDFDFYCWALLFSPVLNCQNHSGDRRSILLYVFPIIVITIILNDFKWVYAVPFLMFLIINSFERGRSKYFRFHENLYSIIDSFFLNDSEINKPYKIYERSIHLFNANQIFPINIKDIYCFIITDSKISILNGSSFVWKFEIEDTTKFINELKTSNQQSVFQFNKPITINHKKHLDNLTISTKVEDVTFSFFLIPQKTNFYLKLSIPFLIDKLIEPFFFRLSRVLYSDFKQRQFKSNSLTELEQKYIYVSNAVNSMHFIRNKLSPIKNYLAMMNDYETTTDTIRKSKIEPHLKKERQKLSSSLSEVLEKASNILSKSNNPFNVSIVKEYGLQQFFAEIRRIWGYYFNEECFDLEWDINDKSNTFFVKYNNVGLELVLSNWISNMNKYNSGSYGIILTETNETYNILFYNSFEKKSRKEIEKFVHSYNTSDRREILRRETHGLIEIKEFLTQMSITSKMIIEDDKINLILIFKKFLRDESTNI